MKILGRNKTENKKKESVFTPETFGVVIILFTALSLICLLTGNKVFGFPGKCIKEFLYGCFGYFAIPVFLFFSFIGGLLLFGRKTNLTRKRKLLIALTACSVVVLVHVISMNKFADVKSYGEYLSYSYNNLKGEGFKCSGGGLFSGLIAYLVVAVFGQIGAYVILSLVIAFIGYCDYKEFFKNKSPREKKQEIKGSFAENKTEEVNTSEEKPAEEIKEKKKSGLFVAHPETFAFKSKRDLKNDETVNINYTINGLAVADNKKTYSATYSNDMQSKLNYVKTPAKINLTNTEPVNPNAVSGVSVSEPVVMHEEKKEQSVIPLYEHDSENLSDAEVHAENFAEKYAQVKDEEPVNETAEPTERVIPFIEEEKETEKDVPFDIEKTESTEETKEEIFSEPTDTFLKDERARNIFGDEQKEEPSFNEDVFAESVKEEPVVNEPEKDDGFIPPRRLRTEETGRRFGTERRAVPVHEPEKEEVKEEKPPREIPPINREYFRPPYDLLEDYAPPADLPKENHEERMEIIRQTLEEFKINAIPQSFVQGPSITRYEIMMPAGVSVKRVLNYDDDLQMRLSAKSGVRIEAPIPGKNLVGIEVANASSVTVGLKEVLIGMQGKTFNKNALIFAIGKDIVGESQYDDLTKGPHYLVAGSSGSGKSVCLNLMIVSLIMRYSPEDLRLILIDPKRVEFRKYEHIPHLLVDEIISDHKEVLAILSWAIDEMERRYAMFEQAGNFIDGIEAYNENIASDTVPRMPKIVIIIDELADLMVSIKKDLETKIQVLTQKARAAGIHIVIATQRPSVNVITGVIKTNLPSRIAFKVGNFQDSQIILDSMGAEKLLGKGDMLYRNSTMSEPKRNQGAFISAREVGNIVSYVIEHNKAYFDYDVQEYLNNTLRPKQEETEIVDDGGSEGDMSEANSELLIKALSLAINCGTISISQVQRRFQIGYIRAAGLIDKMEVMGYISGNEGSKARKVFITREEFEQKFGSVDE